MSTRSQFSHLEIGALRDQAKEYLGKRVVINNLNVPGTGENVSDIQLNTQGRAVLVTSEVEVYPYLQEGTKYQKAFGRARESGTTFAFQVQGGLPAVSIVLPNQEDAIAVVKKLLAEDGQELAWSAALERLGLDRTQFKNFVEVADGILITRADAQFCLSQIEGVDQVDHNLSEHPKETIPNLDSVMTLSTGAKRQLRTLLPQILRGEQTPREAQ